MKIIAVQIHTKENVYPGDTIKLRIIPIVNGEEDKGNPIYKTITVKGFAANEDGSVIRIIGSDNEYYYDDEILEVIHEC
jgi:hypothetical protein